MKKMSNIITESEANKSFEVTSEVVLKTKVVAKSEDEAKQIAESIILKSKLNDSTLDKFKVNETVELESEILETTLNGDEDEMILLAKANVIDAFNMELDNLPMEYKDRLWVELSQYFNK